MTDLTPIAATLAVAPAMLAARLASRWHRDHLTMAVFFVTVAVVATAVVLFVPSVFVGVSMGAV